MSNMSFKKTPFYFRNNHRDFQALLLKMKELQEFNNRVKALIETNLRPYCEIANFANGRLTIMAANSSIATQLRFESADLLRKFKQDAFLSKIQQIHFIVRSMPSNKSLSSLPTSANKIQPLSTDTAQVVESIASSIKDDKLRAIMEKIAKNTAEGLKKSK